MLKNSKTKRVVLGSDGDVASTLKNSKTKRYLTSRSSRYVSLLKNSKTKSGGRLVAVDAVVVEK